LFTLSLHDALPIYSVTELAHTGAEHTHADVLKHVVHLQVDIDRQVHQRLLNLDMAVVVDVVVDVRDRGGGCRASTSQAERGHSSSHSKRSLHDHHSLFCVE